MSRRPIKSRITDYRPTRAGTSSPLERSTPARPGAAAWETGMAANSRADASRHDAWAAVLTPATAIRACEDLCRMHAWDRKNPEHRWIMGRRAALLRRIDRENLTTTSPS